MKQNSQEQRIIGKKGIQWYGVESIECRMQSTQTEKEEEKRCEVINRKLRKNEINPRCPMSVAYFIILLLIFDLQPHIFSLLLFLSVQTAFHIRLISLHTTIFPSYLLFSILDHSASSYSIVLHFILLCSTRRHVRS